MVRLLDAKAIAVKAAQAVLLMLGIVHEPALVATATVAANSG